MTDFTPRYLSDYSPPNFSISSVYLTFNLSDEATVVTSKLAMQRVDKNSPTLTLQGEQLTLISVTLNDKTLSDTEYAVSATELTLNTEAFDDDFELTIVTEINPLKNTSLEGLFKSGDAYCTQCEAEGFRRITYYLDRPDVMSSFTTKIIADKTQLPYLLSNGNKIEEGVLADNKHYVIWQDPFLKPCYLFALVAGDFDLLQDTFTRNTGEDVALEIFVDKGNLAKAEHAMASLKHSMKWDEDTFGLVYDLDIYMIVAVDFFNMGAMENKGLNVFNSKFVLADAESATDTDYFNIEAVIAHEYFHNWTGNRVTCRDWFQLSLKEGLTVFRDQQFSADMRSAAVTRIQNVRVLRSLQFAEDAGPMSHPIRPEKVMEMNNFYTLTVYEKGAEVIRMIHTLLGKDNFRKGMDLYFERFDGMAVTCDDFVNAMSDASSIDLTSFKQWYSQSGTPVVEVNETYNAVENIYSLKLSQTLKGEASQLYMPIQVELLMADRANKSEVLTFERTEETYIFENITSKPTLAFLGGFTAPVKVCFEQDDTELEQIIMYAKDEFCRWDAGQKLLTGYVKKLVEKPDYVLPTSLLNVFESIMANEGDLALKAEQLTLPSFDELADAIVKVTPELLVNALSTLKLFLAQGLSKVLLHHYQACLMPVYANSKEALAKRAFKNVCLSYLSLLNEENGQPCALLQSQFDASDNMTDTLAAISHASKTVHSNFDEMMSGFEKEWSDTSLVMDKWFTTQAMYGGDDIFERLQVLLQHPLFTLKNPNRARSLIAGFSAHNPKYFHCKSGRGYAFLTEQLIQLNEINPQVASRLITPLIQFKGFDNHQQKLMKQSLEKINDLTNLSKDLKEKLDAALNLE